MTDCTDNALKPCPFCGGKAVYQDNTQVGFTSFCGLGNIKCDECGRSDGFIYKTQEAAAKSWNTRADLAPDPLVAVKVKPLEWSGQEGDSGYDIDASPDPYHRYIVRNLGNGRFDVILNHELGSLWFNQTRDAIWPDYASAKAAAQADYETRIRSALEPCDPLADPRVVGLRNLLEEFARQNTTEELKRASLHNGDYEYSHDTFIRKSRAALAALSTGGNDE